MPALLDRRRAAVGKWHLGASRGKGGSMPAHPLEHGFQSWQGTLGNLDSASGQPSYSSFSWWEGGEERHVAKTHATVLERERAQAWVAAGEGPFFLYLAFNAAHRPLELADLPPPSEHGFGAVPSARYSNTVYRAQLECADRQLGLLLAALPADTLVVLLGDNGTVANALFAGPGEPRYPIGHPSHVEGDERAPLSFAPYGGARSKGSVYEGGIRVPLLVAGPGVTPGARRDLVDVVDVFATLAELMGATLPEGLAIDGRSFARVLRGEPGVRTFSFSERFAPNGIGVERTLEQRAYLRRDGEHLWKLLRRMGAKDEFYDVASDPLEQTNLGTAHPAYPLTLASLLALLAS